MPLRHQQLRQGPRKQTPGEASHASCGPRTSDEQPHSPGALGKTAWIAIASSARRISRHAGFSISDIPDLEQELAIAVHGGLSAYQPHRGSRLAFIRCLLRRAAHSLIARRVAAKRAPHRDGPSLDTQVAGADGSWTQLWQTLPHEPAGQREQQVDLKLDLAEAIARLPTELRLLCERLKTQSVAEAAASLGLSRASGYRLMTKLRNALRKQGISPDYR